MKKELTYNGYMLKQECKAMLLALEGGEEKAVLYIANRLVGFVNEIVKKGANVFVEKKLDMRKVALNNLFSMSEENDFIKRKEPSGEIEKTFDIYFMKYVDDYKCMETLCDVLKGRMEYLKGKESGRGYPPETVEKYLMTYENLLKTAESCINI